MVEAASLPEKKISDTDGWSFWPQCQGKEGKKREWIYCYYFPRPSSKKYNDRYNHYEVSFVRDKRFKLYNNGKLFDTVEDVLEKNPLPSNADNSSRKKLQTALDSFPKKGITANRRKD